MLKKIIKSIKPLYLFLRFLYIRFRKARKKIQNKRILKGSIVNLSKVLRKTNINCTSTPLIDDFTQFKKLRLCNASTFINNLLKYKGVCRDIELWFDHSWGGGTEIYTYNEYRKKEGTLFLRIQNNNTTYFSITSYYKDNQDTLNVQSREDILHLVHILQPHILIVNNLAGYRDIPKILTFIHYLKKTLNIQVRFNAHDFQSICIGINMLTEAGHFCNCSTLIQCNTCKYYKEFPATKQNISTTRWHQYWESFLDKTVDTVVVFSNFSKDIITKLYPCTTNKVVVIPHTSSPLRAVSVQPHKELNIAILGTLSYIKGSQIIQEMDKLLSSLEGVNITVFGKSYSKNFAKIKILGTYNRDELPELMEEAQIDIIFISSICPETYSYTTDEAMLMGLPVACFDIGAQAEKISKYHKGLVISEVNASIALKAMCNYIKDHKVSHESINYHSFV